MVGDGVSMTSQLMTRQIQIDVNGGVKTFNSLDDAMAYAATVPMDPNLGEFLHVKLNVGFTPVNSLPLTIPSWVIIQGAGGAGEDLIPCSGISISPVAGDTVGIIMEASTQINNVSIASTTVANFDTEFSIIRCDGDAKIRESRVTIIAPAYTGANPAYLVKGNGASGEIEIHNTRLFADGSGMQSINTAKRLLVRASTFLGKPDIHVVSTGNSVTLQYTRMRQDTANQALSFDISTAPTTSVELYNTRIPLDRRDGGGFYAEYHPTPQQLETAVRSISRDTAVNSIFDSYADGTIVQSGGTTSELPAIATAVLGQCFVLFNTAGAQITVSPPVGDVGVLINGASSFVLPNSNGSAIFQKTGASSWQVISGTSLPSTTYLPIRAVAVSGNILVTDYTVYVDASLGDVTMTLPAPATTHDGTNGQVFNVKKDNVSGGNVIVNVSGGATIDGEVSFTISLIKQSFQFQSNGTEYKVI